MGVPAPWPLVPPRQAPQTFLCMSFAAARGNVGGEESRWQSVFRFVVGEHVPPKDDETTIDLVVGESYPPNLSILISGGKETNRDSLSKGD